MTNQGAALVCLGIAAGIFTWYFTGCVTVKPNLDIQSWAGDSQHSGITRAQDENKPDKKATLSCHDPAFNDYVCLSGTDFSKVTDLISQCKEW